jgi:hypothetical protein
VGSDHGSIVIVYVDEGQVRYVIQVGGQLIPVTDSAEFTVLEDDAD